MRHPSADTMWRKLREQKKRIAQLEEALEMAGMDRLRFMREIARHQAEEERR